MTNPLIEAIAGLALVVAIGAGTFLVLPRREPPPQTLVLDVEAADAERAEPLARKTDAERIEDLQQAVRDIADEQKRLSDEVKALGKRRAKRPEKREGASP